MALGGTSKIGQADFLGGELPGGQEGARGAPYLGN